MGWILLTRFEIFICKLILSEKFWILFVFILFLTHSFLFIFNFYYEKFQAEQ